MNRSRRLATALVLALVAACEARAQRAWTPPRPAPAAGSAEEALPGVDLAALTEPQRKVLSAWAQRAFAYCGAPVTVAASLRQGTCRHAPRMARLAARLAAAGLDAEKLERAVTDYYASFDAAKRARLDLAAFGPPLGDPKAPVAMVEFSDFTCPYCQMIRPALEKFVADHPGRVRLHFKPYPIASHANSLEAAQAVEWARDRGAFWKMHDTLFDNPYAFDPDSLVGFAKELGLDAADLTAALKAQREVPRIRASMEEARAAGLTATPTLFLDGRMLRVTGLSDADLEFTLEDEEEWVRHGGWIRD